MYYDLLAKIKNAGMAQKESFMTPYTRMDAAVAEILVKAKYLKGAEKRAVGKRNFLEITMSYRHQKPVMTDFKILSKPSRRLYIGYRELHQVRQGYGIAVLSTPAGVLSNRDARKQKVGGEHLFQIW